MAEEFIKFRHLRTGYMAPSIHPTKKHFPAAIAKSFRSNLKINELLNQKISMQIQEGQPSKAISITYASCPHSTVIILKLYFTQFGTSNFKSIKPQYFHLNTDTGKSSHLPHVKKLNIRDIIHWIQHWYINTNHTNVLTTSVWINVITFYQIIQPSSPNSFVKLSWTSRSDLLTVGLCLASTLSKSAFEIGGGRICMGVNQKQPFSYFVDKWIS